MSRFNLTNVALAFSLTAVCCGFAGAQPTKEEQASVREHVNKGNMYMNRGAWAQAIDEYNAALDADPGSMVAKDNLVLVHNNWGIALFRGRKYEEAKAQWEEALKMNPYDRNAKQNLQVLKIQLSKIQAAPKPPAEAGAKLSDGAEGETEETQSGPKVTSKKGTKPVDAEKSSVGSVNLDDGSGSSGPKVMGSKTSAKSQNGEAASSGPKIMSGGASSGAEETQSGPAIYSKAQPKIEEVPTTPPPQAAAPSMPEPLPTSTAPPIDLSSPYSFYQQTTPRPLGAAGSPYTMPTNLQPAANRPQIYTPPAVPKQTPSEWKSPLATPSATEPEPASQPAPEATETSANLEDQVGAIEQKLNGKKQKNMPIIKRIEKLENSISGKVGSGTLQERIDILKKSCGL